MKTCARSILIVGFSLALLSGAAFSDTDSMNCNVKSPSSHVQLAPEDTNTASRLQLSRPVAAEAEIELNLCGGDLSLVSSRSNTLKITVEVGEASGQRLAGDYLEILQIDPHKARVGLHLAQTSKARVTIEIPSNSRDLDVNLARGNLTLAADQIGGERTINVGYGHVEMQGNEDSYEGLQVNIGLGSLHDHRKNGENHHFIVAHSASGTGRGAIEINVGMGHVDLDASGSKPI